MELKAIIEALRVLKQPCGITVYTDSEYLRKGISEWLAKWKAQGWKRKQRNASGTREVLNQDLWKELDELTRPHRIRWEWVKGHASHADNLRCDYLATRAAKEQISSGGVAKIVSEQVQAGEQGSI